MERLTHQPKTKEEWLSLRAQDLTSTEVSALFNISPYMTSFELWHQKKKSQITEIGENERMTWGTRLENAIAQGIAMDNGWTIKPFKEYLNIPELRIGSSFDFRYTGDNGSEGILEIKNVASLIYRDGWEVEGKDVEAPPHIEMQLQHQMLVSGLDHACIGALIGGNKVILIHRKADETIHRAILDRVAKFWDTIDKNQEPSADFIKDAGFIATLYSYAEPGKVIETDSPEIAALIKSYRSTTEAIKQLQKEKDGAKAQMLTIIGDAERCLGDGFSISAGVVGEAHIEFTRKAYRNFRVSYKKEKK